MDGWKNLSKNNNIDNMCILYTSESIKFPKRIWWAKRSLAMCKEKKFTERKRKSVSYELRFTFDMEKFG